MSVRRVRPIPPGPLRRAGNNPRRQGTASTKSFTGSRWRPWTWTWTGSNHRTCGSPARAGAPGPWATPPRRSGSPTPGTAGPKPHGPGCKRRRDVGPVVHLVSAPACGGNAKTPSNPVRRATNAVPGVTPPSLLAAAPWSAPPASPDSS